MSHLFLFFINSFSQLSLTAFSTLTSDFSESLVKLYSLAELCLSGLRDESPPDLEKNMWSLQTFLFFFFISRISTIEIFYTVKNTHITGSKWRPLEIFWCRKSIQDIEIEQCWICAVLWWPFWKWRPLEIFQCRE